jgi:hypothetical protein
MSTVSGRETMKAEEASIIEQGALAHKNLEDIISAQYNVVANYFIIAKCLSECQEMSWWKILGDESFNAFLGRPELGFKRSWAYELIKIYRLYVEKLGVSAEDFVQIGPTKLLKMASVVEGDKEKWISDAKVLSVSDLNLEIQGAGPGEIKVSPPTSAPPSPMTCINGCGPGEKSHFPVTRGAGGDEVEDWWIPMCRECHSKFHADPKGFTWTYKRAWAKYLYGHLNRGE